MGKYNIERISQLIRIGWDGENNWRPQTFDCSSLLATRPNGTVTLWILPNGESEAFPVALAADGNLRTWTPLDSELVGGGGKLQFHCQSGTDIGKSPVYRYVVEDSILTGAEHPDDTPSWAVQVVEDVTAAVAGIEDSIEEMLPGAIEDYLEEHPVTVEETDPTVPAWAKQPSKPTYTAQEVGAMPSSYVAPVTSVNGQTGDVALSIPSKTSDLTNDSGFITASDVPSAPVQSVNGKTGVVVLDAEDVGALPDSTVIPASVTVDSALSSSSENPVQNKVIKQALDGKGTYSKPSDGIPVSDLNTVDLGSWLDNAGANITMLSLSGTTVTLNATFTYVYISLIDCARQSLFILPIGGTAQQPIVLEMYTVHADAQNYTITLACVYNGNRYSVTLSAVSAYASPMTGTLVTETIVTVSDIPTAVSDLTNDAGYLTAHQSLSAYQTQAITDTGNYYTTDTVDGALQEIGAELAGINTLIGSGVIS